MKPIILFLAIAVAVYLVADYLAEPIDGNLQSMDDAPSYYHTCPKCGARRPLAVLRATPMPSAFFTRNGGYTEKGKAGDYLVESQAGFRWVISKDVFEKNHSLAPANPASVPASPINCTQTHR